MLAFLRILALTWKELLTILKDKRSRVAVIGPPLMQIFILGYAATYDLSHVPYVVCDQDRSQASRQLLAGLDGSPGFQRLADLPNADAIPEVINRREALMAVQIPEDFQRRLEQGQVVEIQVILDGRNSNTAGTALNYVNSIVGAFNQRWLEAHGGLSPPIRVVDRAWYNPMLETRWYVVPGLLALLTLLDVMILTSLSVAREREQGTLDQLLVSPLRPMEVMTGKAIPSVLVGLIQSTVVLLATLFWFRIPFAGSFLTLYLALTLFLLAAVGVGLLVSSVSATMQQAMLGCFVVLMPFVLLSGLFTPISSMPAPVQAFTYVNPLRFGISIVHRIFLEGATLLQVLPLMAPLIAIAVLSLAAASWMFKHRLA